MNGEQLYGAYCAALWVDYPQRRAGYVDIFGDQPPRPPVAWSFLHAVEQTGWNNLADALAERFAS